MVELLKLCCQLEKRAGQVYGLLKKMEGFSAGTRELFARLEQEEGRHADLILWEINRMQGKSSPVPCDLQFPTLLARQIDEIIETLQRHPISEIEAVRLARNLDIRFWDLLLHNALAFQSEEWKNLFVDLSRDEISHVRQLEEHVLSLLEPAAVSFPLKMPSSLGPGS